MLVTGYDGHNLTMAIGHSQAAAIAELLRMVLEIPDESSVQSLMAAASARCSSLNFKHITPSEVCAVSATFTELIHTYVSQFPGVLNQPPPPEKEPPLQEQNVSTLVN